MSASSAQFRSFRVWQFWALVGVLVASVVVALFILGGVAQKYQGCPGATQDSRPVDESCFAAYDHGGVVG